VLNTWKSLPAAPIIATLRMEGRTYLYIYIAK
jgi:hypothetical protein